MQVGTCERCDGRGWLKKLKRLPLSTLCTFAGDGGVPIALEIEEVTCPECGGMGGVEVDASSWRFPSFEETDGIICATMQFILGFVIANPSLEFTTERQGGSDAKANE